MRQSANATPSATVPEWSKGPDLRSGVPVHARVRAPPVAFAGVVPAGAGAGAAAAGAAGAQMTITFCSYRNEI